MAWMNRKDNERALRLMQEMGWMRRAMYGGILQRAADFEADAEEKEKLILTMLNEGKNLLNLSGPEKRAKVEEVRKEIDRLLAMSEARRKELKAAAETHKEKQEESEPRAAPSR